MVEYPLRFTIRLLENPLYKWLRKQERILQKEILEKYEIVIGIAVQDDDCNHLNVYVNGRCKMHWRPTSRDLYYLIERKEAPPWYQKLSEDAERDFQILWEALSKNPVFMITAYPESRGIVVRKVKFELDKFQNAVWIFPEIEDKDMKAWMERQKIRKEQRNTLEKIIRENKIILKEPTRKFRMLEALAFAFRIDIEFIENVLGIFREGTTDLLAIVYHYPPRTYVIIDKRKGGILKVTSFKETHTVLESILKREVIKRGDVLW